MAWQKAPEWLVARFDEVLPPAGVQRRVMFGYPAAFVNGNMAYGLFQESLVMRVGEQDLVELRNLGAAAFSPMPGRTMKGWVTVPDAVVKDVRALKRWILRALTHAANEPPKGSAKPATKSAKAAPKAKAPAKKSAAKKPAKKKR